MSKTAIKIVDLACYCPKKVFPFQPVTPEPQQQEQQQSGFDPQRDLMSDYLMKLFTKRNNVAPLLPVPWEKTTWMRKHRTHVSALFDSNFSDFSDWCLKLLLLWFSPRKCEKKSFTSLMIFCYLICMLYLIIYIYLILAYITPSHTYRIVYIIYRVYSEPGFQLERKK